MKNNYAYGSLASFIEVSGLEFPVDWTKIFGNAHPIEVEIGFGTGEYLVRLANAHPERNFIGFEQCASRIIKTLRKIHEAKLTNVRLLRLDAVWGFRFTLSAGSVEKVHSLFPCPWPKKKHAKHRLYQPDVLRLINSRFVPGGSFLIVTDQKPYVDWILEAAEGTGFSVKPKTVKPKYETKFERKWREAGQEEFYEVEFVKNEEMSVRADEGGPVQSYFVKKFSPDKARFEGVEGPITIKFGEFIYDPDKKKGMVHALVSEDRRLQQMWILISHTSKGWCVSSASGNAVLPTEGARKAVQLAKDAVERSS